METVTVPAVRGKRIELPSALVAAMRFADRRLAEFESPFAQIAAIVIAAAMASVVGTALFALLTSGLAQS